MAGNGGKGGYRSALRHRDLRFLMARFAVSATGSWAYNVALIVVVYEQTRSPAWVAAAGLGRFLPCLVFSPYGGVVAERFERHRVMLTSDLAAMVLMSTLAVLTALGAPVVALIAVAALNAVVTIVDEPANAAMVPQVVGEDDLAAANGLKGVLENVCVLIGPAIGAALLLIASPSVVFAINAATFGIGAALVSMVRARSRATDVTEGGEAGLLSQLAVGFRAIGTSTTAAILVGFSVLASFVYGTDTVLFPLVGEQLGVGADGYGYMMTGLGIGGILAAGLVNRLADVPRLGVVITVGMAVYSLPTALIPLVDNLQVVVALQVIRGAGTLVVDVLAVTALQRALAPELVARVFGVFFALVLGAISLGALIMPVLVSALGLDGALVAVAVGVPLLALASGPWLIAMDRTAVTRLAELTPKIRLLEVLGIFSGAPRPVLERLAANVTEQAVSEGSVIVKEGEPADALYVLTTGEVAVSARGEAGSARRIRTLNAPAYFGEIGLLQRIARTATVRALEPVTLYRIEGDDFLNAVNATPIAPAFLESAQARLARTHPKLASNRPRVLAEPNPNPS